MTSRELVKRAIHFEKPDRLPHFLPDGGDNDILLLWIERPPCIKDWTEMDNGRSYRVDEWGVKWETAGGGSYGEAVDWPFADVTKHAGLPFPARNDPKYIKPAADKIATNNASDNPKYCLGVMPFSGIHEGTHNIMGLENMYVAYYENPDHLKALIGRLADAQRESIRLLAEAGCDGVMAYDDWGLQDRLMISIGLIEEFFMPHYRKNWALAHELGMDVWMHSCGHIIDVLPTFIDAGLNVIQMDQQEQIGLERLDREVGGKVAFWCPVDIQKTMVEGSVHDVREYVRRMVEMLGSHNGGLISKAYPSPEACGHDPEKTAAMCKAFREFGVYAPEVKND